MIAGLVWTLVLAAGLAREYGVARNLTLLLARNEARANLNKDFALRLWVARHGGVYVPPNERTPPNPYLEHIPDRDVETRQDKALTLMNPAYALRQVMQEFGELYGIKGRITSLKPLNPDNAPDDWEQRALLAFEDGATEFAERSEIEGQPYFRVMRHLVTEPACLKCHAHQGYKVGDVRGGVGVAVPLKGYLEIERDEIAGDTAMIGSVWLVGLIAISGGMIWRGRAARARARTLEELRESEERFRALFENAPHGMALVSPEGRWLQVNDALCRIVGCSEAELLATDYQSITHPDDHAKDSAWVAEAMAGSDRPYAEEKRYLRKDGRAVWVQVTAVVLRGVDGRATAYVAQVQDVTERRRWEENLRATLTDQRLLAAVSQFSLQAIGLDQVLQSSLEAVLANQRLGLQSMGAIFLRDPETSDLVLRANVGFPEALLASCSRVPLGRCLCGQAAETGRIVFADGLDERHETTYEGIHPHGHYCVPIQGGGQVIGVLNVYVEAGHRWVEEDELFLEVVADTLAGVVRRREAEEALHHSEARYRQYFDLGLIGMAVTSPRKGWIEVNDRLCEMLGYGREELLRRTWAEITHPDDLAANNILFERALNGEVEGYSTDKRFIRPDGGIVHTILSARCVRREDGTVDHFASLVQDISDRKQAEETLRRTVAELSLSNADLERFAQVAAHDLQEPVRSVITYAQLLERRHGAALDREGREYLDVVVSGARRMRELVRDLLAYSRVESLKHEKGRVLLADLLGSALRNMKAELEEAGAAVNLASGMPEVEGDQAQLLTLVQHLIGNAVKFREPERPPRIDISVSREGSHWILAFSDNGIGIAAEYLDSIFIIFKRLHTTQAYPGTGIGLALCRRIVERHGGRIWAESEEGRGSTFYFSLPALEPKP